MLEIRSITDVQGNSKDNKLKEIIEKHGSAYGDFLYELLIGFPFYFAYRDDTEKCLRSSRVKDYEYVEKDKLYIITTKNSIYYILDIDND